MWSDKDFDLALADVEKVLWGSIPADEKARKLAGPCARADSPDRNIGRAWEGDQAE